MPDKVVLIINMAAFRCVRALQGVEKFHRTVSVIRPLQTGFDNQTRISKQLCICRKYFKRFQSSDSSSTTNEEGSHTTEPEKMKSWFVRWLHGDVPEPKPAKTGEEINERRILLEKVQEMYFSNPPKAPGVDFYTEAFHLLIKYNDRIGVQNLYEVMKEEKIAPGDELIQEIESYISKAREEAWFK